MQRQKYHPADFGEQPWERLLAYALERSDRVVLAVPYRFVPQDLGTAPLWPVEMEAFRSLVTDRYASFIRWDSLREYPCEFLEFDLRDGAAESLIAYLHEPSRLEDWSWTDGRPEDPTFSRAGVTIMSTESRAGRIAVYASRKEVDFLSSAGVRLLEPLGVKAEPWPTP